MVVRAAGKGEGRARRHDVLALFRVEHVREWEQVELVGAAAMVEDEQAGCVTVGEALAIEELCHSLDGGMPARLSMRRRSTTICVSTSLP